MKVIVSSRFAVDVVDMVTGDICTILTGDYQNLYYGISWGADYMYIARRDTRHGQCMLDILDTDFNYVDTVLVGIPELGDVHQILVRKGYLWVTSTAINALTAISIDDFSIVSVFHPVPSETGYDRNHFNSLWFDKEYLYVIAHNHGGSQLYTFEEEGFHSFNQIDVHNMGMGAHNIYKTLDGLTVLSSADGNAISTNGRIYNLFRNNYPRGLAVGDDFSIVGVSEHVSDRTDRHRERRGAVQLYASEFPQSTLHVRTIELNHGMVFEVRGLDFVDKAHRRLPIWSGRFGTYDI